MLGHENVGTPLTIVFVPAGKFPGFDWLAVYDPFSGHRSATHQKRVNLGSIPSDPSASAVAVSFSAATAVAAADFRRERDAGP